MKSFILLLAFFSFNSITWGITLIGKVPGKYLKLNTSSVLSKIVIEDKLIKSIVKINSQKELNKLAQSNDVIMLNKSGSKSIKSNFDYILPGLIDLHNHTKQNNIGVWSLAKGQFKNRFEWRKWSAYKYSVSGNMNPWISYGKANECAAFRWSEMQAMVIGTTYLQGPSSCIKDFTINQVEDNNSYISKKGKVGAPTDLIYPNEMVFVWNELRPLIKKKGDSYEENGYEKALAFKINEYCDIPGINAENINSPQNLRKLKDKALLKSKCIKKSPLPKKFIRYIYWIHPTIASKKKYLKSEGRSAVIAHLAEGRRDDYYNQKEFELIKLLGLDLPGLNFVHGVGLSTKDFKLMGSKNMGLIWSPFSNLLLYGQTLDIFNAKKNNVTLALGSDWLPTGTRGVLDELKIAAKYIDKDPENRDLKNIFNDEELFKMVTENPAKLINHFENNPNIGEHGIGQITAGAMASFIVTSNLDSNPFTSLVRKTSAKDINLVIANGKPVYGNINYIKKLGFSENQFEYMNHHIDKISDYNLSSIPYLKSSESKEAKYKHLVELASLSKKLKYNIVDNCNFKIPKVLIHQDSFSKNKYVSQFFRDTNMNLDRFEDIRKLIAINILSQTRNLRDSKKGKKKYMLSTFISMYSCDDISYTKRTNGFISSIADKNDEFSINRLPKNVLKLRTESNLGRVPANLEKNYPK